VPSAGRTRDDSLGAGLAYFPAVLPATGSAAWSVAGPLLRCRSPQSGRFYVMPNIKQQKKRVEISSRQRLQNLRYRSTVKTLTKRLRSAIDEGDEQRAAAEYRELVQAIDKAASNRALHRNTAARKKSQAARLLSGN
jgi:small subunit ribosomal protein S20